MGRRETLNTIPIDDPLTVLDLLYVEWGERRTDRKLVIPYDTRLPPFVELGFYAGGYTRDAWSGSNDFLVTPEVVADLKATRDIEGTPCWGYTDERELRITDRGKNRLIAAWDIVAPQRNCLRAHEWFRQWRTRPV